MRQALASRLFGLLLLGLVGAGGAALADDAVFAPGSRVGLVPPAGLSPSQSFIGFEDRQNNVALLTIALPKEAFAAMKESATPEAMKKEGLIAEAREDLTLPFGKAFLVIAKQTANNVPIRKWLVVGEAAELTVLVTVQIPETALAQYPDDKIRKALATLTVRPHVPAEEQLSVVPFKVTDRADFNVGTVLPGRAVLLTDAKTPSDDSTAWPRIAITAVPSGAAGAQNEDRDMLARRLLASLPGIKEMRVTNAEPLRIGGQQGFQVLATAKDAKTDADLTIAQWLRFSGGAFLHILASAPTDKWPQAYPRFRTVRDSVDLR